MEWILGALAVLAALLLLPWVVGRFLPDEYTASDSRTVPWPPRPTFEALKSACAAVDARRGVACAEEADAPRRLVRTLQSPRNSRRGRLVLELSEVAEGTCVRATQEVVVPLDRWTAPWVRASAWIAGGARQGLEATFEELERNLAALEGPGANAERAD